jgi:predicted unusual protein kinase regulating ubiquinone biosynthesis (AarF/ABC1/UbiB family)
MIHSNLYDTEKFLFAQFDLGTEAQNFLNSRVGKYLVGCAVQDIEQCFEAFLNSSMVTHQKDAQRARDAINWIIEAINAGEEAEFKLREMDAEEGR